MKYNTYKEMILRKSDYARTHRKLMMLQMFADEGNSGDGEGDDSGDNGEGDGKGGKDSGGRDGRDGNNPRTYSDADVDRIVAKHKANWEKEHAKEIEAAKDEARKYERMSKEQREEADRKKAAEESAKKDARIAQLEQQIRVDSLRKSVAADVEAMPEGIAASQDFLDLVVSDADTAETADANVKKLVGIILADRKAQEEKRARGTTPRTYNRNNGPTDPYQAIIDKYK